MILMRTKVRPIILTIVAPAIGFALLLLLEMALKIELDKLPSSLINLAVVAPIAFVLFPRVLGIPFGRVDTRYFLRRIGLTLPPNAWKHLLLGLILAACTLSGMLLASILTGRYTFDLSTVDLPHLVFCLNPGLWEELFFRGVLMLLLLRLTRSLRKAVLIQLALFGIMHIKGTDFGAVADLFSAVVLAAGFTYVAYQTRSLLAGIVFHYVHDALLYLVQLPGSDHVATAENLTFYGLLWLGVAVAAVVTRLVVTKLEVRAPAELYALPSPPETGRHTLPHAQPSEV